jgi:hypothetical protein
MQNSTKRPSHIFDPAATSDGPIAAGAGPGSATDNIAPVPLPSKRLQNEAFAYVTDWCKASYDFVKRKTDKWHLLEDLYHNRRDLGSWTTGPDLSLTENRAGLKQTVGNRKERWQSDIILAPSYIVDSWADRAYQAVFHGPEWLSVLPENIQGGPVTDAQYPTSYKLQELLLSRLSQGQIHVRLYEILQHLVLFGSVYAKLFWYSKSVTRHRWNYETLEVVSSSEKIFDCPVVQVIPLDRLLVDWTANHGDVQRHSGIGHRVDRTYEQIKESFDRGVYNLNEAEFVERWKNTEPAPGTGAEELLRDEDSGDPESDPMRKLTIWEWHGQIPTSEGHKECLCTFVTERGAESPEDGIMIRLTDSPVLWSGLRPFLSAHYTPLAGPFGLGAVESNLDLLHAISQFISQSQDNARLTANAQLIVRRGSSAARQISAEDDVVYPGKVWTVDDPKDIQPFPNLNFPQNDVNNLINYLNSLLEKRTTVSDITLGMSGRSKSATEANILQENALSPFSTRIDLFARSFIEPLGRIGLSMLQQFLLDDQFIAVKDSNGADVPLVVTAREIQSGLYRVAATLTRQESTRIAKAQSIERALPTLAQFQPILAQEGFQISFSELLKRYLDLIGVEGADRIFGRVLPGGSPNASMPAGAPGMPGQMPVTGNPGIPQADVPPRLVENGGPMGPNPTDANALAQLLQMQAQYNQGGTGAPGI